MSAPFSIGRVLKDSFQALGRNFIPIILVALVLDLAWAMLYRPDPVELFAAKKWTSSSLLVEPFAGALIADLLQLIVMFAVLRTLRGQRAGFTDFTLGFRSIPFVAAASIIAALPAFGSQVAQIGLASNGFAAGAAMIIFGIAALIVKLMLWVATPSIAAERRGVRDGLARSLELTKGRRWKLFGLSLAAGLMILPFLFGIHLFFGVPFASLASLDLTTIPGATWFGVTVPFSSFFAVLMTVSYHHLRIEKDGVEVDQVVTIFD